MSRPKFQKQAVRVWADLDLEPLEDPWSPQWARGIAENVADGLPSEVRPYYSIDDAVTRITGKRRHEAYLRRTGGVTDHVWYDVEFTWTCCNQVEMLSEWHRDRHGYPRPDEVARVKAMAYYHRCPSA